MRKFSKILAMLLAVCAIFGIVAMSVSGEEATNQLDPSTLGSNITHYYDNPNGEQNQTYTQIAGKDNDGTNDGFSTITKMTGTSGDNSYTRVYSPALPSKAYVNNSTSFFAGLANSNYLKFGSYAYHVIDLDIGFDAYLVNGELDYTAESGEIAYLPGMWLGILDSGFSGYIYFVKDDNGVFYLSTDKTYSEGDIKLPTEKDVFTHITYVANNADKTIYVFGKAL